MNLSAIGTEEEIKAAIERLNAVVQIDCSQRDTHFSVHAAGNVVSVLAHEIIDGHAPIIGIMRFTPGQWAQLKDCLDPLVEKHVAALTRS